VIDCQGVVAFKGKEGRKERPTAENIFCCPIKVRGIPFRTRFRATRK
jgi:hypothetical protein